MEYSQLREQYRRFYYRDYQITESSEDIHIVFDFEIEGLSHFNPDFRVSKPEGQGVISDLRLIREAAFSLGLVELISYWKITCPEEVVIECGSLDEEQTAWWKKLYYNGLSGFFQSNNIETDPESFMRLRCTGEKTEGRRDTREYRGNLIPVGGGKNSFVTLEVLSGMYPENHAFIVNHVMAAVHSCAAAGYSGKKMIVAERSLDPRMLEFNRQGYLNGHTPFSALTAFAAMIAAAVYGKRYICLSNETIPGEADTEDDEIQLQYSRTYAFEKDLRMYIRRYLSEEIEYFSLLRPLSELQITGMFSRYPRYFRVFRSCNVGQKTESWCCRCEKCLYVCIMLSAFADDETLRAVFGRDMLNDESLQALFEKLAGLDGNGSPESADVNRAVCMSLAKRKEGEKLPYLYELYRNSSAYTYWKDRDPELDAWNDDNTVPAEYRQLLKEKAEALPEAQMIRKQDGI